MKSVDEIVAAIGASSRALERNVTMAKGAFTEPELAAAIKYARNCVQHLTWNLDDLETALRSARAAQAGEPR